jgi:hypothetical protein
MPFPLERGVEATLRSRPFGSKMKAAQTPPGGPAGYPWSLPPRISRVYHQGRVPPHSRRSDVTRLHKDFRGVAAAL